MWGLRHLRAPKDFGALSTHTLQLIDTLKLKLVAAPPSLETLYLIDEISDSTTTAADISQACLMLHPDPEYRQAAADTQSVLSKVFLELNSDRLFYDKLIELKLSKVYSVLSPDQKIYTERLIADFEKEGLHLDSALQDSKKALRAQAEELAGEFMENIQRSKTRFNFKYDEIEFVPVELRPEKKGDMYEMKPHKVYSLSELRELMLSCKLPSVRKRAFEALMSACESNEKVLPALLSARSEYAKLLGWQSFTDFTLKYQMFPTAAADLTALIEDNYTNITRKLGSELGAILDLKARLEQEDRNNPVSLAPWDLQFYSSLLLRNVKAGSVTKLTTHYDLSNYFSMKNVLSGLQILLKQVFDLESSVHLTSPSWSNDILTMELYKGPRIVGVLYLDMFARPHKYSTTAAKLNLVCSRQTKLDADQRQVPHSVLVCNLTKPPQISKQVGLSFEEIGEISVSEGHLTDIYHEFGHAVHSLVSDCEFQCFSGTRVPLDLAEFPSHLFEMFLTDYNFVSAWALHKTTSQPIPEALCRAVFITKREQFKGLQHQLLLSLSLLDLKLHSGLSVSEGLAEIKQLQSLHYGGERWPLSLPHLAEYGSSYYAYMVGQALAEVVWEKCFERHTLNADAGAALLRTVLSRGGDGEGRLMIAELLQRFQVTGDPSLEYAFDIDVFQLIRAWYQSFGCGAELVTADKLRKSDSFKHIS
jgi:intermediate peptidase